MAKQENPEPQKPAPVSAADKKKKEKALKRFMVPPLIDMIIDFSSKAFLLVSLLVALVSFGSGCDLTTIFVRTLVAMIVTGLLMWVLSWWITQQYIAEHQPRYKATNVENSEGMMKDIKA
jgi:hypothetical protein